MPYCSKCGAEVDDKATFCPKCGAPVGTQQPVDWREHRREIRREWRESRRQSREARREAARSEKAEWEKTEKYEKHERVFIEPLVGGLILILLGIVLYMLLVRGAGVEILLASFFLAVGLIIIAAAVYGLIVANRKHPKA